MKKSIPDAEYRVRKVLADHSGFPVGQGYEPLVAALLKTESVVVTLTAFGWDPNATSPLSDKLEAALGIGDTHR